MPAESLLGIVFLPHVELKEPYASSHVRRYGAADTEPVHRGMRALQEGWWSRRDGNEECPACKGTGYLPTSEGLEPTYTCPWTEEGR